VETANPYGLDALWKNGDFVARFVLSCSVMSMGSWYIMVTSSSNRRANRRAKSADQQLWKRRRSRQARRNSTNARRFASSPKPASTPPSITTKHCSKKWIAIRGFR
jgi:hypothetical protein